MRDQIPYVKDLVNTYEKYLKEAHNTFDKKSMKVLCNYKGSFGYDINKRLRNIDITRIEADEHPLYEEYSKATKTVEKNKLVQKYIRDIDKYIVYFNQAFAVAPTFKRDTILYRIIFDSAKYMPPIGQPVTLNGYISCSFDITKVIYYYGGLTQLSNPSKDEDPMILKINVKKGVPYIFLDAFCLDKYDMMDKEGEIVLPHGLTLQLTKKLKPLKHIKIYEAELY